MNAQHTPGPWQIGPEFLERCGAFKLHGRPISGGGKAIARVWSGSDRRLFEQPDDEANARLIAAAPDLLSALRGLLEECDRHGAFEHVGFEFPTVKPAFDAARAALAKAEGSR